MSKTHKKKRSTGIIYECLLQHMSKSLIEGDERSSSKVLKILKKHFKPGTELYKEFRLINSLMKTTVESQAVAGSILTEAKKAARAHDMSKLDREKSLLLRSINHTLSNDLLDQQVNEYRTLATIQMLLNDWRDQSPDIERMARYEDQLVSWLTTKKPDERQHQIAESPGESRLLMRIMMKKLNDKYTNTLLSEQKNLIRTYVWAKQSSDQSLLSDRLNSVKRSLIESIEIFRVNEGDKEYNVKQLESLKSRLLSETLDSVDDELISRFMLYIKLDDELRNGDK